ncbi:MAG: nuclear transport factor 2 family protein [Candidatus Eisenbacteria bacterium]|nr:nuclear transport factor 2 family protein [Candidatus Eisenbacteria bacterium]
MLRRFAGVLAGLVIAAGSAVAAAPDSTALSTLLTRFLDGAGRNDVAMHDRFWADDLIYTGSSGRRIGKEQLMRDVREAPAPDPKDPVTRYTAEEVRIQQYGASAIVAFRLVATTVTPESTSVGRYLNTGFFLKRKGEWRAAGWQATKLP